MTRPVLSTALAMLLLGSLVMPASAAPEAFDGDPATVDRVGSNVPINSAVAISQLRFASDTAAHVVLSRVDNFADSLAGAALTTNGPMLFTETDRLSSGTRNEIDRVLPADGRVFILGGPGAVSSSIEEDLRGAGYEVARLAGPSRIETAVAVAREVRRQNPNGSRALLARAYGSEGNATSAWADSIAGGAWAAQTVSPILVTGGNQLHPAVDAWLREDSPDETFLLGGQAALSQAVEEAVAAPVRIAGSARDGTATAIAERLWKASKSRSIIVNGYIPEGWTFGFSSAGLAADLDVPVVIVAPGAIPDATARWVSTACGGEKRVDLLLVGGENVIPEARASELEALDAPPCPPRSFGNGTYRVPEELRPGTYRTVSANPEGCYWERLSGFSGDFDDIKANEITEDVTIVTVLPEDAGFSSERCSKWSSDLSPRSAPTSPKGAGDYQVGTEWAPGLWRNSDSSGTCYWERLSGWTGEFDDIIANGLSEEIQTVEIKSSDVGFSSSRCGTWTKIG